MLLFFFRTSVVTLTCLLANVVCEASTIQDANSALSLVQGFLQVNHMMTRHNVSADMLSAVFAKHQTRINKLTSNEKFWEIFRSERKSRGLMAIMRAIDGDLGAHLQEKAKKTKARGRKHEKGKRIKNSDPTGASLAAGAISGAISSIDSTLEDDEKAAVSGFKDAVDFRKRKNDVKDAIVTEKDEFTKSQERSVGDQVTAIVNCLMGPGLDGAAYLAKLPNGLSGVYTCFENVHFGQSDSPTFKVDTQCLFDSGMGLLADTIDLYMSFTTLDESCFSLDCARDEKLFAYGTVKEQAPRKYYASTFTASIGMMMGLLGVRSNCITEKEGGGDETPLSPLWTLLYDLFGAYSASKEFKVATEDYTADVPPDGASREALNWRYCGALTGEIDAMSTVGESFATLAKHRKADPNDKSIGNPEACLASALGLIAKTSALVNSYCTKVSCDLQYPENAMDKRVAEIVAGQWLKPGALGV